MKTTIFKQLLEENQVIIPIIQRDYAQGRKDDKAKKIRTEFLTALHNATTEEGKELVLDFIYGTRKSMARKSETDAQYTFTPLDGQQRLTTLFLLHWYAKNVLSIESDVDLSRFTYMTHPAARQFCQKLAAWDKKINKSSNISRFIKNEVSWWIAEWEFDPTIAGMLTMLNAIHDKFKDVTSINLDNVKFYLYPPQREEADTASDENGDEKGINDSLSEDIYIKMNARGLPLTPFEKVKGRILDKIPAKDDRSNISSLFDRDWTDVMWNLVKEENNPGKVMDGYFIRFIRFICDTFLRKRVSSNDYDMVDKATADAFTVKIGQKDVNFFQYLTKAFECLKVYDENTYTYLTEELKVDLSFRKCLAEYTDKDDAEKTAREFDAEKTLLLYAFLIKHMNGITDDEFHKRLRWVRNLIWNSNKLGINNLKEALQDTQNIILYGLDVQVSAFDEAQLEQEKKKESWCNKNSSQKKDLYSFEDHDYLHGNLKLFENMEDFGVKYKDTFTELHKKDNIDIGRALVCDETYPAPHIIKSKEAWQNVYHISTDYKGYGESVLNLLKEVHERSGNDVNEVANALKNIIEERKERKKDWRYYFAEYREIHQNIYCERGNYNNPNYNLTVMHKSTYGGWYWNAYLLAMYLRIKDGGNTSCTLDGKGGPLTVKGYQIYNEESRLRVVDGDGGEWERKIDQVDKIDNEDRVEVGIDLITRLSEEKDPESIGLERIPAGLAEFAEGEVVDGGAEGGEE